eukprot:scaffold579224_cov15-Prasinocladus_malaysianus.AAC.1
MDHALHRCLKGARGDTTSHLAGFCLETLLGPQVDILFVEYVINEQTHLDARPKTLDIAGVPYENLLRRAAHQYPTAVIIGVGLWGRRFKRMPKIYHIHEAAAKHNELGWVSADPMAFWMIDNGHKTKKDISLDYVSHPTQSFHDLLAKVIFVQMIQHDKCLQMQAAHASHGHQMSHQSARIPRSPLNIALQSDVPYTKSGCDYVGKPKFAGEEKLQQVVGEITGWSYVKIAGPKGRRDQLHVLVPNKDAAAADKIKRRGQHKATPTDGIDALDNLV